MGECSSAALIKLVEHSACSASNETNCLSASFGVEIGEE